MIFRVCRSAHFLAVLKISFRVCGSAHFWISLKIALDLSYFCKAWQYKAGTMYGLGQTTSGEILYDGVLLASLAGLRF